MKKFRLLGLGLILASGITLASCSNGGKMSIYGYNADGEVKELAKGDLLFKENSEIPYISLDDSISVMNRVRESVTGDKSCNVSLKKENNDFVIYNSGAKCTINSTDQTFKFDDYDRFVSVSTSLQNPLSIFTIKKDKKAIKQVSSTYEKGQELTIDLKPYSKLDIYEKDNKCYIPLSVYNTVLLNTGENVSLAYNGSNMFLIAGNSLSDRSMGMPFLTELGTKFRENAKKDAISEDYANYYYQSLCFDFNTSYGLKSKFTNFDTFLTEKNYKTNLLSTNPMVLDTYTDIALSYLNDGHTNLSESSICYEFGEALIDTTKKSQERANWMTNGERFAENKKGTITAGLDYQQGNDTVFVSFDEFSAFDEDLYYMGTMKEDQTESIPGLEIPTELIKSNIASNTALLFNKLYQDLTSDTYKNSIHNIVIDLTSNDGGSSDSLVFALSTLIGNVEIDIINPLTGARNHQVYKADINVDGKVDDNDRPLMDLGFKIYFLNSNYTFSSGNAMPVIAKANKPSIVTLGAKTGGGPCAVRTNVTPIGSLISSSSLSTIAKYDGTKYVDIDGGIEAQHQLTEAQMIDRAYIRSTIGSWN